MYIKDEKVKQLDVLLNVFGLNRTTSTGNFLINTLLPDYEDIELLTANDEFYLESLINMCSILSHRDWFPRVGFIPEMLVALGLVNARYMETPRLARVLGMPTASAGVAHDKYDRTLRRLNLRYDKVYQFLIGIHTCGMSPGTTTMANKMDVRYPSLVRDAWLITLLNPETFAHNWTTDYIRSNVKNPTPDNLISAVDYAWKKAKTLFGKSGTYKILNRDILLIKYWAEYMKESIDIIENEEVFKSMTSLDTYKYLTT
jgi:hypothetical protein